MTNHPAKVRIESGNIKFRVTYRDKEFQIPTYHDDHCKEWTFEIKFGGRYVTNGMAKLQTLAEIPTRDDAHNAFIHYLIDNENKFKAILED
jgi:hypothetical protein